MFKFMRKIRRDFGTVNSWVNLGRKVQGGYFKSKQRLVVLAVVVGVAIATKIAKVAPKVADKMIKFIRRKPRRVGRGTEVREKEDGNIKDAVIEEEEISKEELEDIEENGVDTEEEYEDKAEPEYETSVNTKEIEKVKKKYEEGERKQNVVFNKDELRLFGQVIEACKQYNDSGNSIKVKYEMIGNELNIDIEGNNIIITKEGMYSMSGNVYYEPDNMSEDDAVTRLAIEYPVHYLSLLVVLVLVYTEDIFEVEDYKEVERMSKESKEELDIQDKEKEIERQKKELRQKQIELQQAQAKKHLEFDKVEEENE